MKPGRVIVDLAGEAGGNCELTAPGETVVRHDVKIVSPLNLPSMAEHSSQLFARNVLALLTCSSARTARCTDFEDQIVKGALHRARWRDRPRREESLVHEAAAAAGVASKCRPGRSRGEGAPRDPREHAHDQPRQIAPAGFIGFVEHLEGAQHAPHAADVGVLNAIHGIVLLGGLLVIGLAGNDAFNKVILVIAITFGTINIVGGFLVTDLYAPDVRSQSPSLPRRTPTAGTGGRRGHRRGEGTGPVILATTFLQQQSFLDVLHHRVRRLSRACAGSRVPPQRCAATASRAVGMAIAVIATLLNPLEGNWGLIVLGIALGTAVGVPGAPGQDDGDAAMAALFMCRPARRGVPDLVVGVPAHEWLLQHRHLHSGLLAVRG